MADEEIVGGTTEEVVQEKPQIKNKVEERITDLSEKVKTAATERDTEKVAREAAEKERDFYKGLTKLSAKHPNATDYEDEIREKVMKGYDMEDAAIAVLSKKGKLTMNTQKVERETVAGGSATTNPSSGSKGVKDMSQTERLAALREAEARGEIGLS